MDDGPLNFWELDVAPSEREYGSGAMAGVVRGSVIALGSFLRQSIPGTLSGIAEDTSAYPFDLVKTKMQMSFGKGRESSATNVLQDTIQQHGFRGLFRGLSFPLVTGGLINGVLFGTYGSVGELLDKQGINHLDLHKVLFAGSIGGVAQSFVTCPVELIKVKMQISHGSSHFTSLGLAKQQSLRGLYRGITSTLLKD